MYVMSVFATVVTGSYTAHLNPSENIIMDATTPTFGHMTTPPDTPTFGHMTTPWTYPHLDI